MPDRSWQEDEVEDEEEEVVEEPESDWEQKLFDI